MKKNILLELQKISLAMFRKNFFGIFQGSISAKLEEGHFLINKKEAIEYYKKAALLRNPDGMYNYARMLEYVLHDKEKSVEFYERAANMRNTKAMIRYAEILESLNDPENKKKII